MSRHALDTTVRPSAATGMRSRFLRQTGMSLIETAIVLSVLMTITGILAPGAMTLVEQAREIQVQRDCASLRDGIVKLLIDSNRVSLTLPRGGATVDMLVSAGPAPDIAGAGDPRWSRTPDAAGRVDLIDRYLVENTPAGNPANAWPVPTSFGGSGWRGAYLSTPPAADPWGHRYAMNVRYLNSRNAVVVISAGPNGVIETPFEGPGLLPEGDDRLVLVR